VLAVPGEITSALSRGSNALLRVGAVPVTCAGDILEAIGLEPDPSGPPAPADGSPAAMVLDAVDAGATTADEVVRATGLASGAVAAVLVELELGGVVAVSAGVVRR
jgi:DNA processing protein